jgi:hypothetical protein
MADRTDTWRGPVLVAAAGFLLAAAWIGMQVGDRQPIQLLYPGERSGAAPLIEEEFGEEVLIDDSKGYDGAAFWAIARHLPALDDTEPYLTEPRYRFQRILTPAIASLGGDGNGPAVILLLLGPIGVALGAWGLADVAQRHGRPAWLGILFFFPLALSVAWGLSEPMAFGLAMVGVALADRGRLGWAALAFTVGALAREPAALVAIATAFGLVACRRTSWRSALVLLVPALVTASWALYLTTRFEATPSDDRLHPFGLLDAGPTGQALGVVVVVLGLVAAWTWRDVPAVWPIGLLFVALTLSYGGELFRFQVVYRAAAPAFALGVGGLLAALVTWTSPADAPASGTSERRGDETDLHAAEAP